MTIRKLKEIISGLPDDMRVYADDGYYGMFSNNGEFVEAAYLESKGMLVLQTKDNIYTAEELEDWLEDMSKTYTNEQDAWIDFVESGFSYNDFDEERWDWAKEQLENYGLI